jgi:hypothetical protein
VLEELGRACAPGPFLPTALVVSPPWTATRQRRARRRRACCLGWPGRRPDRCRRTIGAEPVPTRSRRGQVAVLRGSWDAVLGAVPRRPWCCVPVLRVARDGEAWAVVLDDRRGGRRADDVPSTAPGGWRGCALGRRRMLAGDRHLPVSSRRGRRRRDRRPAARRGRGGGRGGVVRRHRGGARPGARAVRSPDRSVPGGQAPLRRHAVHASSRPERRRGTRPAATDARRAAADLASPSAAALGPEAVYSTRPRTASRCSAASASRGSTTPTST